MKKLLLSILMCTTVFTLSFNAQILNKDKEITFTGGIVSANIKNSNIADDSYKVISKQNGYVCNLAFNKYFKKRFGFGIGVGASNYKQTVNQKGLFASGYKEDQDGLGYNKWISSNMVYTYNLTYVDVPITLHLLLGKSSQFYGFLNVGVVNGFLVSGKYTEKGSIETMNRYPDQNGNPYFYIITQNNPYYGVKFQSYDKTYSKNYKSYNCSGRVSVGLVAALNDKVALRVEPSATIGITDITSNELQGKEYMNVFGEPTSYSETKTFSFGISAGFSFNL